MTNPHKAGEGFGEAEFVDHYAATKVNVMGREVPLSTALEMEATFCPADLNVRRDPAERVKYLARMVGEGLLPEHQHLLELPASGEG